MRQLAIALLSLVLATEAQAQSLKEKFELSERCGKQAAERFAKFQSEHGLSSQPFNYENHYNSPLNKCFYLETFFLLGSEPSSVTIVKTLVDLHENREIGRYHKPRENDRQRRCSVQEKQCTSEEEWRSLIKPFMED
jgi:hypothetical protein